MTCGQAGGRVERRERRTPAGSSSSSGSRRCRGGQRPRPAFTSGTTSGTAGSMRNALDLSTTTQPRATASGANARDVEPPAEKSARSKPSSASAVSSRTSSSAPAKRTRVPAERADANGTTSAAGNPRSWSTSSTIGPTAPVAPTTATRGLRIRPLPSASVSSASKASWRRRHGLGDPVAADDARDLDRRRRDHPHVDPEVGEHLEHLRGDARDGSSSRRRSG